MTEKLSVDGRTDNALHVCLSRRLPEDRWICSRDRDRIEAEGRIEEGGRGKRERRVELQEPADSFHSLTPSEIKVFKSTTSF